MFWHFCSILHRVDHHFIMNMLFFPQFLHIFDPNLPTTPSVNWKFAVVSWLLGSHLHLKYGTSHAEKKKTWLSSQCCTNQRQKAWLYPQESDKRWAKEMCTTCEIQGSRTWLHPFKAMEQRPAPNQDMQATCVHTERSDRIVSSSCIVLAPGPKYACVLWLTLVTSRRISETLLLRGTDMSARRRRARRRTHLVPAAAAGWQSWRLVLEAQANWAEKGW